MFTSVLIPNAMAFWDPPLEMRAAMWTAMWNASSHYMEPMTTRPNWQQTCPHNKTYQAMAYQYLHANTTKKLVDYSMISREWTDPSCDAYSMGGGMCLYQVIRNTDTADERQKLLSIRLLKSSCQADNDGSRTSYW